MYIQTYTHKNQKLIVEVVYLKHISTWSWLSIQLSSDCLWTYIYIYIYEKIWRKSKEDYSAIYNQTLKKIFQKGRLKVKENAICINYDWSQGK